MTLEERETAYHEAQHSIDIILSDITSYATSTNYAINYCRAAKGMVGHEFRVQCAYILNNITHWRHPQAKLVRSILREYSKSTL
jgi:hypothetical protein